MDAHRSDAVYTKEETLEMIRRAVESVTWCFVSIQNQESQVYFTRRFFKVQMLLQEQFSEKMRFFPYIQEVGKERKTRWISTLRDRKKEGYAMQVKLIIQERLKDLRVERGLTLEQLAQQTGLSKSALGKYETDDFKDISPFSIVTLAKFFGVSTDYLLGMTETKNHPDIGAGTGAGG